MGPLAWLVVGLVAGFLASRVLKDRGSALLADLILGVVGAVWVPAEAVHGVGEDAMNEEREGDVIVVATDSVQISPALIFKTNATE